MTKKDIAMISMLIALCIAVFYPIYPELVKDWLHLSDNSHAFLVPLATLVFVWQKRDRLGEAEIGSSLQGGLLLVCSLAVYLLSYAGGVAFTARLALVFSLFGLLWFCLGDKYARLLAFPVFFLLFMVPVPYSILSLVSMPLQLLASKVSVNLIEACSIPVIREGNMLFFTNTQLEVAEACSGIRSITALIMLGVIFTQMSANRWMNNVVLVLSAIPIALFANIARVSGTGILAHFHGEKVAKGFLHEFSGLVVFVLGFLLMLLFSSLLNKVTR